MSPAEAVQQWRSVLTTAAVRPPGGIAVLVQVTDQHLDPGVVLPLLSNTLRHCWTASAGDTLTASSYLTSGGLWASLNDEAEAVLQALPPGGQQLVQRLMLSLVVVDAKQLLRRSIPFTLAIATAGPGAEAFVASRLLSLRRTS